MAVSQSLICVCSVATSGASNIFTLGSALYAPWAGRELVGGTKYLAVMGILVIQ